MKFKLDNLKVKLKEDQISQVDKQTIQEAKQNFNKCLESMSQVRSIVTELISSIPVDDLNILKNDDSYYKISQQILDVSNIIKNFQTVYSQLFYTYLAYDEFLKFKDPGDLKYLQRNFNKFSMVLDICQKELDSYIKTSDIDISISDDDWAEYM